MTNEEVKLLQQLTKVQSKKELTEWGLWLLQWVIHQRQRGCSIVAMNDKASIFQTLDFPLLQEIDLQATTAPLSEYPNIAGEQTKHLLEEGRVHEAEEVVQVMKTLQKRSKKNIPKTEDDRASVSSTMNLEAAKIMAEEGDPRSALTLIEKIREESSSTKKR